MVLLQEGDDHSSGGSHAFFGGFHSHAGTQKWMLYKGKSYFRKPPHIAFDFGRGEVEWEEKM